MKNFNLIISEPLRFYCKFDEDFFYKWLKAIPGLKGFEIRPGDPLNDIPNEILLHFKNEIIDDEALQQLRGLLMRYQLDMSSLLKLNQ